MRRLYRAIPWRSISAREKTALRAQNAVACGDGVGATLRSHWSRRR